jgi:hypothetical protein
MAYIQAQITNRTVYLTLADVPATSLLYTDVTVNIKKSGQTAFTPKVLASTDWVNLGNGLYTLVFSALDMDTLGDFTFVLSSSLFDNFIYDEFTIEPAPIPGVAPTLPTQCIVTGTVVNQMALPPRLLKVTARPAQFPAKDAGVLLAGDIVWTFLDAYGNFSLPLIKNSVVIIEIERTGIRAQITIPDAPTANITDLLPPISTDYSL